MTAAMKHSVISTLRKLGLGLCASTLVGFVSGCLAPYGSPQYGATLTGQQGYLFPSLAPAQVQLPSFNGAPVELPVTATVIDTTQSVQPIGAQATGPADIALLLAQPQYLTIQTQQHGLLSQVSAAYNRNQGQPFWHDGTQWLPAAQETIAVLRKARRHGLDPRQYLPQGQPLPNYASSNPAAIAQSEIALTSGLLRYIIDVVEGRYAPQQRLDPVSVFFDGASSGQYLAWLEGLTVDNWIYRRMSRAGDVQIDQLNGPAWDRFRVTMERLRWDAPDLPTNSRYVLVNIGSAEVWAMNGLRLDLGANAVIGRPSRSTPLRDDQITGLKFAPDWTAPYSIVEKDLVKFAQQDPNFINLMGVEITRNGRRVDPFEINWNTINVRNYTFRQPPGPTNVLGGVRFNLVNSSSIYMHDSPDQGLFDDPFRAKSSGCIRVGAADELALWLLQGDDPNWNMATVQERMRRSRSNNVQLSQAMPVKTIYTTAWVSHNGRLVTMPDAYGQNNQLRARMGLPVERVSDDGLQNVSNIGDVF